MNRAMDGIYIASYHDVSVANKFPAIFALKSVVQIFRIKAILTPLTNMM